jgi:hypothetical protein
MGEVVYVKDSPTDENMTIHVCKHCYTEYAVSKWVPENLDSK